jgi:hypothetical protein
MVSDRSSRLGDLGDAAQLEAPDCWPSDTKEESVMTLGLILLREPGEVGELAALKVTLLTSLTTSTLVESLVTSFVASLVATTMMLSLVLSKELGTWCGEKSTLSWRGEPIVLSCGCASLMLELPVCRRLDFFWPEGLDD